MVGVSPYHAERQARSRANAMKKEHLPQAFLDPFGTFEIEISEIFVFEPS